MNSKFSTIQRSDISSLLLQSRVPATGVNCQLCIARVSKWLIISLFPQPVSLANIFTLIHLLHCWLLLLLLLLLLLTAIELSLGGSSPYTSTDKTNKNKYS